MSDKFSVPSPSFEIESSLEFEGQFKNLPRELQGAVFSFLDSEDLKNVELVSRQIKHAMEQEIVENEKNLTKVIAYLYKQGKKPKEELLHKLGCTHERVLEAMSKEFPAEVAVEPLLSDDYSRYIDIVLQLIQNDIFSTHREAVDALKHLRETQQEVALFAIRQGIKYERAINLYEISDFSHEHICAIVKLVKEGMSIQKVLLLPCNLEHEHLNAIHYLLVNKKCDEQEAIEIVKNLSSKQARAIKDGVDPRIALKLPRHFDKVHFQVVARLQEQFPCEEVIEKVKCLSKAQLLALAYKPGNIFPGEVMYAVCISYETAQQFTDSITIYHVRAMFYLMAERNCGEAEALRQVLDLNEIQAYAISKEVPENILTQIPRGKLGLAYISAISTLHATEKLDHQLVVERLKGLSEVQLKAVAKGIPYNVAYGFPINFDNSDILFMIYLKSIYCTDIRGAAFTYIFDYVQQLNVVQKELLDYMQSEKEKINSILHVTVIPLMLKGIIGIYSTLCDIFRININIELINKVLLKYDFKPDYTKINKYLSLFLRLGLFYVDQLRQGFITPELFIDCVINSDSDFEPYIKEIFEKQKRNALNQQNLSDEEKSLIRNFSIEQFACWNIGVPIELIRQHEGLNITLIFFQEYFVNDSSEEMSYGDMFDYELYKAYGNKPIIEFLIDRCSNLLSLKNSANSEELCLKLCTLAFFHYADPRALSPHDLENQINTLYSEMQNKYEEERRMLSLLSEDGENSIVASASPRPRMF